MGILHQQRQEPRAGKLNHETSFVLRRVGFSGLAKAPIDLEIFVKTPDARVLRNRQRLAVLSLGRNR